MICFPTQVWAGWVRWHRPSFREGHRVWRGRRGSPGLSGGGSLHWDGGSLVPVQCLAHSAPSKGICPDSPCRHDFVMPPYLFREQTTAPCPSCRLSEGRWGLVSGDRGAVGSMGGGRAPPTASSSEASERCRECVVVPPVTSHLSHPHRLGRTHL